METISRNRYKIPICPYFDFKAHLRRVCAYMVHLTYNDTKRRKMPIECKIELYTRYVFNVPCYFVPCYSVQIPEYCAGYARLRLSVSAGLARTGTVFSYERGAARCSPAHTRPRRSALPCTILTFSGQKRTGAAYYSLKSPFCAF